MQNQVSNLGLTIGTSLVERFNLTLRHALAHLTRKYLGFCKDRTPLRHRVAFYQVFYNFARPHLRAKKSYREYPCPCGCYGDDRKECTCSMGFVQRYQKRISGTLMDHIDIHLDVMRVPFEKLSSLDGGEPSSDIRARVEAARVVQAERFAPLGKPHVLVNGDMDPASAAFEQRRIK